MRYLRSMTIVMAMSLICTAAAPAALAAPAFVNGLALDGAMLDRSGGTDANPFTSAIQCPLDTTTGCFKTDGGAPTELPADGSYTLLPGVLHAYKVPTADLGDYVRPIPHDDEDDEG